MSMPYSSMMAIIVESREVVEIHDKKSLNAVTIGTWMGIWVALMMFQTPEPDPMAREVTEVRAGTGPTGDQKVIPSLASIQMSKSSDVDTSSATRQFILNSTSPTGSRTRCSWRWSMKLWAPLNVGVPLPSAQQNTHPKVDISGLGLASRHFTWHLKRNFQRNRIPSPIMTCRS